MGGGDLNMKKSWHPVLLVNQEKVWKAEKAANEEKKKLQQLRKEQEEERQLAELQRLQEQATGRKRVEKVDWMYAAPGNDSGALGGARLGEKEMEDYLLGKKRVDEVLGAADKNIGNTHKDFIPVQNANNARDTAAKIREDPLLAIKRQELAQMEALKNRPDIRRKLKEMAAKKGESKEERKARKRAEKEDRRRERHERRHRDDYSRSPRSDYSEEREYKRRRDSHDYDARDRSDRREERYRGRERSTSPKREYRSASRSRDDRDRRRRDDSPPRRRDRRDDDRDGDWVEKDGRVPPPRHYPSHSNGNGNGHDRDVKPDIRNGSRPSAMDMADRPTSHSSSRPYANGNSNGHHSHAANGHSRSNGHSAPNGANGSNHLDEQRAARLAAMTQSASTLYAERTKSLAERAENERREAEKEEEARKKYGRDDVKGTIYHSQAGMNLSDSLSRRAGQGLQRDI